MSLKKYIKISNQNQIKYFFIQADQERDDDRSGYRHIGINTT